MSADPAGNGGKQGKGNGGDGGTAAAAKKAGVKPRGYVVFRPMTVVELGEFDDLDGSTEVLVRLGSAETATPKAARVEVAKAKVDRTELTTDDPEKGGVELHAIAQSALDGGRAPVRLVVEEKFA